LILKPPKGKVHIESDELRMSQFVSFFDVANEVKNKISEQQKNDKKRAFEADAEDRRLRFESTNDQRAKDDTQTISGENVSIIFKLIQSF
jgi:hypothetical protein